MKHPDHKFTVDRNYQNLVKHNLNSIYDDIRYEQDSYITWNNLHLIGQIASYINQFRQSKNPSYIDLMVILISTHGFRITGSVEKAVIDAALCRYNEKNRGGIREIKRINLKENALQTMFNLHYFLEISKQEASERSAYYYFINNPNCKLRATSLYKEFNKYIKNNDTVIKIKNFSHVDRMSTIKNWQENIKNYPMPPDGHEVLGK